MIRGVDVSHWQGDIDFGQLKTEGYEFAMIKATQGTWFADPCMEMNVDKCRAINMPHGLYHFLDPIMDGQQSGNQQYEWFMEIAEGNHGLMPDALDCEWQENLTKTEYTELVLDYLVQCPHPLEDPGQWLLYSNLNFLNYIINKPIDVATLADIWLAWPSSVDRPKMPTLYAAERVKIWQYDWSVGLDKNKVLDEAWYRECVKPGPQPDPEYVVTIINPHPEVKIEVRQE